MMSLMWANCSKPVYDGDLIIYLFTHLYQATRPINIINTNRKRQTDTQICRY